MPGQADSSTRIGLELAWLSGLARLLRRVARPRGLIYALEQVSPDDPADFAPNAHRQLKPGFLAALVTRLRQAGFETVGIDEALRRKAEPRQTPFAVITLEGGWRDAARYAVPVLKELDCPYACFAPTAWVDDIGVIWWLALEEIIAAQPAVAFTWHGETGYFRTGSDEEKLRAYQLLYGRLAGAPEPERLDAVRALASQYGHDLAADCRDRIVNWSELARLAADPLCTIGAMGVSGRTLAALPLPELRDEVEQSCAILEAQLGPRPRHLAVTAPLAPSAGPVLAGLGIASVVTRHRGGVGAASDPMALPCIGLRGDLQSRRYLDALTAPALLDLVGY